MTQELASKLCEHQAIPGTEMRLAGSRRVVTQCTYDNDGPLVVTEDRTEMIGDRPRSTRTSRRTDRAPTWGHYHRLRGRPQVRPTWGITIAAAARGELFTVMPERGLTPPRARATVHSTWVRTHDHPDDFYRPL